MNFDFWNFFDGISGRLKARQSSFRKIFEYLDSLNRPCFIVETGCTRQANNYEGDGQSTVLFDKYAQANPGSLVYTVDLDPKATETCSSLVSGSVKIHTGDSIAFLKGLGQAPPPQFKAIDLLYLDSYDVDFESPHASALHHMKELVAIAPLITPKTLVVIDDSPHDGIMIISSGNSINFLRRPKISGKGKYVAEYAESISASLQFSGYQCGWLGF